MIRTLTYLTADWKIEKVDLLDITLAEWFIGKNWSTERRGTQQKDSIQQSPAIPEITVQINRWMTLVIYVLPKGYRLRLSKDLVFGLAAKSTEAFVTSKVAVEEILHSAQTGKTDDLVETLRSIEKKESKFTQLKNVLVPLAVFLGCCYFGYLAYEHGETYQPIRTVDELVPIKATLIDVNYQQSKRGQNYKFHLYTAEHPVLFYLSPIISPATKSPEQSIENIISKLGKAPIVIHIPKSYTASLQQTNAEIPIYSFSMLNHIYITPEETVRVDIAYKEEQAPFFAWFFPLQGLLAMFIVRYRLARNLFGRL